MFPAYPMISSHARQMRPFMAGTISIAENNTNDVIYLIRQGQQVVVEEDGGGGYLIILAMIPQIRENNKN